jgi:hypothetical protein
MPAHDGLWSNQYERRSPVPPDPSQGNPKQPVTGLQTRPTVRPPHRHQLLAQRQILQDHFAMSAECQRQRTTDDHQQLEHVSILAGEGARINSDEFWRGSGYCARQTSGLDRGPLPAGSRHSRLHERGAVDSSVSGAAGTASGRGSGSELPGRRESSGIWCRVTNGVVPEPVGELTRPE